MSRAAKHLSPPREARAARLAGLFFLLSAAGGVGLLVVYALGGQVQLEGTLLGVSLGGIGMGLVFWGKYLFPHEVVTEDREPMASEAALQTQAGEMIEAVGEDVTRRRFLSRLLLAAVGAFGVAMIFPLRSLGPSPGRSLLRTSWQPDSIVVDEDGFPVTVNSLQVGGVLTVFPEHHTDAADSQAILVRVEPDQLRLPPDRTAWAPDGLVCYSKICTHAGCPVGLYVAALRQLQCPCHQSAFDVTNGAEVVFGPASRPLPQLPLYVDENGLVRARSDFPEPVGPGYWNRPGS